MQTIRVPELKDEGDETQVTFTPDEQYAFVTLTYLVDNVCLHTARVKEVEEAYRAVITEQNREEMEA